MLILFIFRILRAFPRTGRENDLEVPLLTHVLFISDLEEALHVLQDINPTVTEVVLLRHTWAGALHHILPKTPLSPFTHVPLHLQVPETNTHSVT